MIDKLKYITFKTILVHLPMTNKTVDLRNTKVDVYETPREIRSRQLYCNLLVSQLNRKTKKFPYITYHKLLNYCNYFSPSYLRFSQK